MDNTEARLLRQSEPYHYQRQRNALHWSYPRASQPNTNQPNAKSLSGWEMSSLDYWNSIQERYMARQGPSSATNLALGGG